ncbi:hypothetical protein TNCV_4488331 [Trichonephila clavipes]|nr:hypothetical protein TNCV_4488331 [Trichonephila clavipes]
MVVYTGANVSIIREDLARNSNIKIIWTPPFVSLQTVTGDKIQVHGKANITLRFCVDYHRLNDVIKKDSYPLPRIDDTLAGNTWFSTMDLKIWSSSTTALRSREKLRFCSLQETV